MNRDETKQILMRIQCTYPNWKPAGDLSFMVDIWNEYLAEYDYKQIIMGLNAYITTDTSGFAPSIGQLIDKINSLTVKDELNEMEAWSLVSSALRNGCYGAEEEFGKLPAAVQKAVGSAANLRNWAQTDIESVENVIQSNFMRTYRVVVQREREYRKLPESVRLVMNGAVGISSRREVEPGRISEQDKSLLKEG